MEIEGYYMLRKNIWVLKTHKMNFSGEDNGLNPGVNQINVIVKIPFANFQGYLVKFFSIYPFVCIFKKTLFNWFKYFLLYDLKVKKGIR